MKAMQCCPTIKSSLYIKYNRRSYNMKHKPYTQGLSTKANYNDIYSGITMLIQRCSPGGFLSHTQNIYIITSQHILVIFGRLEYLLMDIDRYFASVIYLVVQRV